MCHLPPLLSLYTACSEFHMLFTFYGSIDRIMLDKGYSNISQLTKPMFLGLVPYDAAALVNR